MHTHALLSLLALASGPQEQGSSTAEVHLTPLSVAVPTPICLEPRGARQLVLSLHYPNGQPYNFAELSSGGVVGRFGPELSGLTGEVDFVVIRPSDSGGFVAGELYAGNGAQGQLLRLDADAGVVTNPWATLPSPITGRVTGLCHDRTGSFDGDLLGVTETGHVFRIDASGAGSALHFAGLPLEGCLVVPDEPERHGALAGRLLVGSERSGRVIAVGPDGSAQSFSVGLTSIEELELVVPEHVMYGVDYGRQRILGASAAVLEPYVGELLLVEEFIRGGGSGLHVLRWDHAAATLQRTPVTLAAGSEVPVQWESVAFARAGLAEMNGYPLLELATPGPLFTLEPGRSFELTVRGRDWDHRVENDDSGTRYSYDDLELTAEGVPAGAVYDPAGPWTHAQSSLGELAERTPLEVTFSWTPRPEDVGRHQLTYRLHDGELEHVLELTLEVTGNGLATTYGAGLPGSGGRTPGLVSRGAPVLGETLSLEVSDGVGGATGWLVLSDARADGTGSSGRPLLVQRPFRRAWPLRLSGSPGAAGAGSASVPIAVPVHPDLAGLRFYLQAVLRDPGARRGWSTSNGVELQLAR